MSTTPPHTNNLMLPLESGVLDLVKNADKELRDDRQAGACAVFAGIRLEAVRQVQVGQAQSVVAKVLGMPKASGF